MVREGASMSFGSGSGEGSRWEEGGCCSDAPASGLARLLDCCCCSPSSPAANSELEGDRLRFFCLPLRGEADFRFAVAAVGGAEGPAAVEADAEAVGVAAGGGGGSC